MLLDESKDRNQGWLPHYGIPINKLKKEEKTSRLTISLLALFSVIPFNNDCNEGNVCVLQNPLTNFKYTWTVTLNGFQSQFTWNYEGIVTRIDLENAKPDVPFYCIPDWLPISCKCYWPDKMVSVKEALEQILQLVYTMDCKKLGFEVQNCIRN